MVFSISEFPANIYTFITYGIAYALPPVSTFSILYQYYIHQSFLYTKPIISHIWYCITVSSLVEPPPPHSEGRPLFWVPPLSEANLKNLRAIQIGACKLHETL